jgi:hypothetical protein
MSIVFDPPLELELELVLVLELLEPQAASATTAIAVPQAVSPVRNLILLLSSPSSGRS